MRNPKWGSHREVQCKIFDCYKIRKNICCQECKNKETCPDVCLNHPSRCQQSIPAIEPKYKVKQQEDARKHMVFQEKGQDWDDFDIKHLSGGRKL